MQKENFSTDAIFLLLWIFTELFLRVSDYISSQIKKVSFFRFSWKVILYIRNRLLSLRTSFVLENGSTAIQCRNEFH